MEIRESLGTERIAPPFSENDPLIGFLKSIQGQHVHFFPKSGNAGDGLIAYATHRLLERYDIRFTSHQQDETVEGATVLIGGGGNLIEGRYNDVAELIRRHAGNNKVVLLPHTIVGFADVLAETHHNLTVFCREPVSHQLALLNGARESATHLAHDMVFYLEDDHFRDFSRTARGFLDAYRVDGEAPPDQSVPKNNIDISLSWNGDIWTSPDFCRHVTHSLAEFIAPYESVRTNRLHIAILSAFLGKKVWMMPNAYFKNRAVFEHSIAGRFPDVEFVNTLATIDAPSIRQAREPLDVVNLRRPVSELERELASARQCATLAGEALERETTLRERAERSAELRQQNWQSYLNEVSRKHECEQEYLLDEISELRNELGNKQIERANLYSQLDGLRHEAGRAIALHQHLNAVLTSTIWRMSKPARTLIATLRSLRRRAR